MRDGWKEVNLADVCEFMTGPAFKGEIFHSATTGTPILRGNNLGPEKSRWNEIYFWPDELMSGFERYFLKPDDVCIAMDATYSSDGRIRACLISEDDLPSLVNQRVMRLRAMELVLSKFLWLYVCSADMSLHLNGRKTGAFAPHISGKDLRDFRFFLPSVVEQNRIVDLVESIDAVIQCTEEAIAKARTARAALLSNLLNPTVDGELKDGWTLTTLGQVTEVNPESISNMDATQLIKYVDLSSVSEQGGIRQDLWVGTLSEAPGRAKRVVRADDVLISTVRPYLRGIARVTPALDGQVASTGFCVLRALKAACAPGLLWAFINQDKFFNFLMTRATGSNYPAVRPKDVSDFEIALPPLIEQQGIVLTLEGLDAQVSNLQNVLALANQSRSAILHDLLTGNHEISDSYDRFLEVG